MESYIYRESEMRQKQGRNKAGNEKEGRKEGPEAETLTVRENMQFQAQGLHSPYIVRALCNLSTHPCFWGMSVCISLVLASICLLSCFNLPIRHW